MARSSVTSAPPPLATSTINGLLSATDKAGLDNAKKAWVNLLDFGADPTGAADSSAAFNAAIAALPGGGWVVIPAGTFTVSGTITINKAGIKLVGSSRNNSLVRTTSATADVFLVNEWFVAFENFSIGTTVTRTAGYAINAPTGYSYCSIRQMQITGTASVTWFNCINASNQLSDVDDVELRFFTNYGVFLSGGSDHRMSRIVADNSAQSVAGVRVELTASLLLTNCNLIHCGNALDLAPSGTNTVPSVKAVNCFFDTSTNGVRFLPGSGFIYRCSFTACWMGSCSNAGVLFAGASVDGVTFDNCEMYGNAYGVLTSTAPGDWLMSACRVAGSTICGIDLIGGSTHFPQIVGSDIGPQSAFGVNAIGFRAAAGTYKGLRMSQTKVVDNTTNASIPGTTLVATADAANYSITDCPGINPRGSVSTPSVPASGTTLVNQLGFRCMVYLRAGTVSAVTVNNANTGMTASPSSTGTLGMILDPGGRVNITYTVAPGWSWIGM